MSDRFEDVCMKVFLGATAVFAIAFFVFIIYAIIDDLISEKITLRKSEWTCSQTAIVMKNVWVGKILTQQNVEECFAYRRKVE